MASFQSGINQLLGMAGLFSQLPAGQSIKQERLLKQKEANVEQRYNILQAADVQEGTAGAAIAQEANEVMAEVKKAQFERKPTRESYAEYAKYKSGAENLPLSIAAADPDEIAQEIAEKSWQNKAKGQITQNTKLQQLKALVENYNKGMFQNLPIATQQRIAQRVSEIENEEND